MLKVKGHLALHEKERNVALHKERTKKKKKNER
jgi:hypothetical protein